MSWLRVVATAVVLAGTGAALSGCIIAPVGPGWCYYHPYRCR